MIKKRQKTKLHTKFIILCYNRVGEVDHMVKILVVEDEYDIRELLQNYLLPLSGAELHQFYGARPAWKRALECNRQPAGQSLLIDLLRCRALSA